MVWGFANVTISTNLARDLGTRMVAAIFFGGDAFNRYAPIAVFVNIPATIFATCIYEVMLRDSFAIIAKGHNVRTLLQLIQSSALFLHFVYGQLLILELPSQFQVFLGI